MANIKNAIMEKKAELLALSEDIENGDDAAIEQAAELKANIEQLEAKAAKIEEAKSLIEGIGTAGTENPAKAKEAKTFGEKCAQAFKGIDATEKFSKSVEVKTDPTTISGRPTLYDYDTNPVNTLKPLTVADLFGRETISGNALTYYVVADKNGAAGTTEEGAKKNQVDFAYTAKTVALTKVTGYIVETDEILEDSPWLASAFQNRLINKVELAEEAQLINGNGTAPNMTGVLSTSGIGALTFAHGSTLDGDTIFAAIMKVKQDSNLDADAIVINPADYQRLRLSKDSNGQYFGGGMFYGEYGNGSAPMVPSLWGLNTVISTAVSAGTCLVGAFKQGASIVSKSGLTVQATNSNEADFVNNRVTIRAEKREALAVRVPAAFVKITEAAS